MTHPIRLGPNQPPSRPYRGGAGIRALRGEGATAAHSPEDWVASTTATHGDATLGVTILPDGRSLADAIAADPEMWLGAAHVARYGADTGVLVKILDTGERLFNHFHPDAQFAAAHLRASRGKTESWYITSTGDAPSATVWLGFTRDVTRAELTDWFERQDRDALLDALNPVTVVAGDWIHVPAGTPHAIGPGITLVELQEPTDLSIVLEYSAYPMTREQALLGLPLETALDALPTDALSATQLDALHGHAEGVAGRSTLLPPEAAPFYRAEHITGDGIAAYDFGPEYAVLVVINGSGSLTAQGVKQAFTRGETFLVPYGAGPITLSGSFTALRFAPPQVTA